MNDKVKAIWERWLYYNADMLIRHVGTAGMASIGTLVIDGHWNTKAFFMALAIGAVIPTIFTIAQKGLPRIYDDVPEGANAQKPNPTSNPGVPPNP